MQELRGESRRKRSDRVAVNFYLPLDAREILVQAVGPKSRIHGQFLARLLYEYQARQEARREALAEAAATGCAH
jgi:hypothetical protein